MEITRDAEEIKRTIIEFFDQHWTNKFEKMVEIGGFLGKYKSLKLMREKI